MSRTRKAIGVLIAATATIGLSAGSAGAQNLDINELAAAVALPLITGGQPPNTLKASQGDLILGPGSAISLLTITNGRAASTVLKIDVISGDPNGPLGGDQWQSDSFDCLLSGRETVTFLVIPNGPGSIIYGECSTALAVDGAFANRVFFGADAANGIFFAAAGQPVAAGNIPPAISEDILLADAVVIDVVQGQAYSFGAIPFQAGTGSNNGDKVYKFDGLEYSKFPASLATNFIAPDTQTPTRINAELILFTLDGSVSALAPPRVSIGGLGYDDDEVSFDWEYTFDCFDVVSLTDLSQNFAQLFLGSLSGHLSFASQQVGSGATDSHDATFGDGNNSRNRGVHGWIVQNVLANQNVVLPGQPTALPAPPGQPNAIPIAGGPAAWGRPLSQGRTALVPFLSDQDPVLDAQ